MDVLLLLGEYEMRVELGSMRMGCERVFDRKFASRAFSLYRESWCLLDLMRGRGLCRVSSARAAGSEDLMRNATLRLQQRDLRSCRSKLRVKEGGFGTVGLRAWTLRLHF